MNVRITTGLCAAALVLTLSLATADEPRFSMDYRNARLEDVLRALAAQANIGLVTPGTLTGSVTLKLKDVTFDEALRHVSDATGVHCARSGSVLTVNPQGVSTRTYNIRYVSASAVRDAISKVLSAQGTADVFNGSVKDDIGKTGELVASNTLVVRDNDAKLDEVAALVASLDKRPRQIEIDAKLVEVSLNNDDKMGIEWQLAAHISGATMPTTFPFDKNATGGDYSPTGNTTGGTTGGAPFPKGQVFPYASPGDFTFGKLSASEFSVALAFLSSHNKTNLVSNPRISTLENKPAEILVGTVVPIAIYQYSQLGGNLQLSGYEEKRIGVKLAVNPRVTEDGRILMSVHPEISEIVEYRGQFNERPVTSNREASTEVMIKDGETLVIGGLVRETSVETVKKVPFLGDIPFLGALFTSKHTAKEKVELMVFVTPHLLPE